MDNRDLAKIIESRLFSRVNIKAKQPEDKEKACIMEEIFHFMNVETIENTLTEYFGPRSNRDAGGGVDLIEPLEKT